MSELKPCPFCGGEAEADSRRAYMSMGGNIDHGAAVYCRGCNADMMICRGDTADLSDEDRMTLMVENWNRRAEAHDGRAAGFGDVRAARREALEEVRSLVNRLIRERVIALASAGSTADLVAARVNEAKTIELEIQNLLDKPATDWRALAEKLAGALGDVADGAPRYIVKVHTALAAAYKAGIGGDRD